VRALERVFSAGIVDPELYPVFVCSVVYVWLHDSLEDKRVVSLRCKQRNDAITKYVLVGEPLRWE
jgi:hypothetical protein